MILLDFNQIFIAGFMAQLSTIPTVEIGLVRHMVLNSVRYNHKAYSSQYGELVIAVDSKSWRRNIFPYYKARRKVDHDKGIVDWHKLHECLNIIATEIHDIFPYRVVKVEGAEGDDIIGTIARQFGKLDEPIFNTSNDQVLIVSGDKDFGQLQCYCNVLQIDPVHNKKISIQDGIYIKEFDTITKNPYHLLEMHILKGDRSDGIPNFLSQDNALMVGERQKPIRKSKLGDWLGKAPHTFCSRENYNYWKRNQKLISLEFTPNELQSQILDEFRKDKPNNDRKQIMDYLVRNRLDKLMELVNDF